MPQVCCVALCYHTGKTCKLKNFPSNPERAFLWESSLNQPDWERKPYHRMCECHFDPNQFEAKRKDGLRKLRPDAVPLIFPTHSVSKEYTSEVYKDIIELTSKWRMDDETDVKDIIKHTEMPALNSSSDINSDLNEDTTSIFSDYEESNSSKLFRALELVPVNASLLHVPGKRAQLVENQESKLISTESRRSVKVSPDQRPPLSRKNSKQKTDQELEAQFQCKKSIISSQKDCLTKTGSQECIKLPFGSTTQLSSHALLKLPENSSSSCPSKVISNNLSQNFGVSCHTNETKPLGKAALLVVEPKSKFQSNPKSLSQLNVKSSSNAKQGTSANVPQLTRNKSNKIGVLQSGMLQSLGALQNNSLEDSEGSNLKPLNLKIDHLEEFLSHLNSAHELKSPLITSRGKFTETKPKSTPKNSTVSRKSSGIRFVSENDLPPKKHSNTLPSESLQKSQPSSKRKIENSPQVSSFSGEKRMRKTPSENVGKARLQKTPQQKSNSKHQKTPQQKANQTARKQAASQKPKSQFPIEPQPKSKSRLEKKSILKKRVKYDQADDIPSKLPKAEPVESRSRPVDSEKSPISWLRQCVSYLEQSDELSKLAELEKALRLSESESDNIQVYLKHLAESEKSLEMYNNNEMCEEGSESKMKVDPESNESQFMEVTEYREVQTEDIPTSEIETKPSEIPETPEPFECPESFEVMVLKNEISQMENKIRELETELHDKTKEINHIHNRLQIFNPDQLQRLILGSTEKWSEETILKAAEIKMACGPAGYKLLVDLGWPLPCMSVLDRRLHKSRRGVHRSRRRWLSRTRPATTCERYACTQ